jgi:hypothetical protein
MVKVVFPSEQQEKRVTMTKKLKKQTIHAMFGVIP